MRNIITVTYLCFSLTLLPFLTFTKAAIAEDNLFGALKGLIGTVTKGDSPTQTPLGSLSNQDIIAGLKSALKVGTERVVAQLGKTDGYLADPAIHIPLPENLQKVRSLLKKFGLSALTDDVENRINRAAEAAAPKTKELFWKAIRNMTIEDANRIYNGPDDAATRYFEKIASTDLKKTIRPIVESTLKQSGAVSAYDQLMGEYKNLPFVPDIKNELAAHATDKALDGLLHYLAIEEAAIRKDPVKRTTEILQKVFSR